MRAGDIVEDFELVDDRGQPRRLSRLLAEGPVVLYFYPAAMTAGCTAESCHFRDLAEAFAEVGATRIGISPDPVDKQHEFTRRYAFDFPLLSDPEGRVARQFGVRRPFGPLRTRRRTFVIDTDRSVLRVISSELHMATHADQALDALRSRHR